MPSTDKFLKIRRELEEEARLREDRLHRQDLELQLTELRAESEAWKRRALLAEDQLQILRASKSCE